MKTSLHRRAADTDFASSTDARPSISSSIGAPGPSHLGTWESTNRKAGHAAGSRASFFDTLRAGSVQLASVKWHRFPGIASLASLLGLAVPVEKATMAANDIIRPNTKSKDT